MMGRKWDSVGFMGGGWEWRVYIVNCHGGEVGSR
jgi:hypothetical protein